MEAADVLPAHPGPLADAPRARNLFHIFEECCRPKIGADMLRIGDVFCPAWVQVMPGIAGLGGWQSAAAGGFLRFGNDQPLASGLAPP